MATALSPSTPQPSAPSTLRARAIRLAEMVATPLVPSDYLDLISPLRSANLRGRIVSIHPETADSATLVIATGRGWQGHVPGQYVRIGIDVDGVRQWRNYSLTSPPRRDGHITVTVKAIPGGLVSNHLVRRARPGTVVQLDQAAGEFIMPPRTPAKLLFVTGGSGITPVLGMLRGCGERLTDVVLVHSAPTADAVICGAELRGRAADGHIQLIERHTRTDGRLDVEALERLVPDLSERETWACGPDGLLDSLEAMFTQADRAERLHTERFRPRVLVVGEGGSVTFTHSGVSLEADGGTALLDVGEAAGVLMPSGCRMGVCFTCVVPLREGAVRDLRSGDVTTAAVGDGVLIQTCVSAAAGACHIEL